MASGNELTALIWNKNIKKKHIGSTQHGLALWFPMGMVLPADLATFSNLWGSLFNEVIPEHLDTEFYYTHFHVSLFNRTLNTSHLYFKAVCWQVTLCMNYISLQSKAADHEMVKATIPAGGSLSMHYCHVCDIWMERANHTRNGGRFTPLLEPPQPNRSYHRWVSSTVPVCLVFMATNMLGPFSTYPTPGMYYTWPESVVTSQLLPLPSCVPQGLSLLVRPACCALANASSSPGTLLTPPYTCRGSSTSWWRNVVRGKWEKEVQWESPHSYTCRIYILLSRKIHSCGMPHLGEK